MTGLHLTQIKAEELLAKAKAAARLDAFTWEHNRRQEELVIAVTEQNLEFLLSLKRNPFEITAQLRTRERHIPLARIDNAAQHINPDGSVIRGGHLHWYKEGFGLAWAEKVDWYLPNQPVETVMKFLDLIQTKFPNGFQEALL
jgi:hypothetical protein